MNENAPFPHRPVRISPRADGIELYFPPLRSPVIAVALGIFGALCVALPLLAVSGALPAGGGNAHGLLVLALLGAFVAPFPVFGTAFIALAVYLLANSLTVTVTPRAIGSVRRVFGLAVRRRQMQCAKIAALDLQIAAKYQYLFGAGPRYGVIARHAAQPGGRMVVAENLEGEAAAQDMRALIARHAGLE